MPTPDVLISDLGGVMLFINPNLAYEALAEQAGITKYDANIFTEYWRIKGDEGLLDAEEFWKCVCCELGLKNFGYRALHRIYAQIWTPNRALITELALWRKSGRPAYLLSNISAFHWENVQPCFPKHLFDRCFLSFELRARKPREQAFRAVLEAAGVPPERCLFIDDQERNIAAAAAIGMDAWRYTLETHEALVEKIRSLIAA